MTARTVTAKLRYPDFSIVTRSQSFEVGIDDAETIGNLACELLDRALRQRPGRSGWRGRRGRFRPAQAARAAGNRALS